MTAFRDFSITNKIRTIVMIVSTLTLLTACGILGTLEVINFRQMLSNELSILTKIIADRSTASLVFNDPQIAHETLDALKVKESIVSAFILDASENIFASYYRPGAEPGNFSINPDSGTLAVDTSGMHMTAPVMLENEKIGTVFIRSDLNQMYALILKYIGYVALALFIALLTAFFMLTKLHRFISRPILDLANAAGFTAANMDYSARVKKKGNDEIGRLVDAFNAMMDQIRQRDKELNASRNRAETAAAKARELAEETRQANLNLQTEINERKRIYNALRASETKLKESHKQLEKGVAERTAELRKTNAELRTAIQAADAAANAKREFLANISHEIRTPMNGVISAAELALSENIPLKVEQYLKIIHASGNALLGIINDILDFSKIDSGKLVLENQDFQLEEILYNAISLFSSVIAEKDIELLLDIRPETPMDVVGDPLKYQQVLTNLLSNAVKFTGSGGMILVEIHGEPVSDHETLLICAVSDTGIGMKSDHREQLFQAFTQGDTSSTRKFGGTGLGLCISHQIVELMHGQIFVESEFGEGSKFTFTAKMGLSPNARKHLLVPPERLHGLNILVVDDSAPGRRILCDLLERFGFYPKAFNSGLQALNYLKACANPNKCGDLAIIDIKMQEMDGVETAVKIRGELEMAIPIILMTNAFTDFAMPASDSPVIDGLLSKPVTASALYDTIIDIFKEQSAEKIAPRSDFAARHQTFKRLLSGLKILVAEDNQVNQELAVEILSSVGITAKIAAHGAEAVKMVSTEKFDAVLMDIHMPGMNGYEATGKIRSHPDNKALPIIAMTASALAEDQARCEKAGMNGFVPKPVRQETLFTALVRHVRPQLESELTNIQADPPSPLTLPGPAPEPADPPDHTAEALNFKQAAADLNLELSVYQKILMTFFNTNIHTMDRLRTALQQNQWKRLQSLAHGLKGTSGNIGADKISRLAEKIEHYCNHEHETSGAADKTDINDLLRDLETHLKRLMTQIKKQIHINNTRPARVCSEKEIIHARPVIRDLANALKTADPFAISDALDRLRQIHSGLPLAGIENKITEYDYDEATDLLNDLLNRYPGQGTSPADREKLSHEHKTPPDINR